MYGSPLDSEFLPLCFARGVGLCTEARKSLVFVIFLGFRVLGFQKDF